MFHLMARRACEESRSISNRHSATLTIGAGIEYQPKVAGRIDEGGNGVERHRHASSDAPEKQVDFKTVVTHDQMLELVLQDDAHVFRVFNPLIGWNFNALGRGQECNRKMMVAPKAVPGGVGEHVVHDAPLREDFGTAASRMAIPRHGQQQQQARQSFQRHHPHGTATGFSQSDSNAMVVSGRDGSVQRLAMSMQGLVGSFGGDAALPFASHPPLK
jgi:hypothetical protein